MGSAGSGLLVQSALAEQRQTLIQTLNIRSWIAVALDSTAPLALSKQVSVRAYSHLTLQVRKSHDSRGKTPIDFNQ